MRYQTSATAQSMKVRWWLHVVSLFFRLQRLVLTTRPPLPLLGLFRPWSLCFSLKDGYMSHMFVVTRELEDILRVAFVTFTNHRTPPPPPPSAHMAA